MTALIWAGIVLLGGYLAQGYINGNDFMAAAAVAACVFIMQKGVE